LFDNNGCEVVGSCNGLLCLVFYPLKKNYKHRDFFLRFYNPATRLLSKKRAYFRASKTVGFTSFRFSFGYDDLTAKYKVVAYNAYRRSREVSVFTLGDNNNNNSWRSIPSFPKAPYNSFSIYLSNSLNWLSHSNHIPTYYWKDFTIDQFVIISLDLGMETYTEFHPPRGFDEILPFMPKISLLTDCLCFSYYTNENDIVIWKMREFGVQDSWIKLFKFSHHEPQCNYLNDLFVPLHLFESDNTLLFILKGEVVQYNSRENKVEKTRIRRNLLQFCGKHYVESLVSTC
jgi:F-box interacting protein